MDLKGAFLRDKIQEEMQVRVHANSYHLHYRVLRDLATVVPHRLSRINELSHRHHFDGRTTREFTHCTTVLFLQYQLSDDALLTPHVDVWSTSAIKETISHHFSPKTVRVVRCLFGFAWERCFALATRGVAEAATG